VGAALSLGFVVLVAQDRPAEFYFGGNRVYVGMPEPEAIKMLSVCCRLSPEQITTSQKEAAAKLGRNLSQFIVPKEEPSSRILGTISFDRGRVTGATRPLGQEAYVPWDQDVVSFARTLQRSLSPVSGDAQKTAHVSVHHERSTNGESEILSISFTNGRGLRLQIITLDKPLPDAPPEWSKEQAILEEFLE
jgi:hypothetical protein